MKKIKFNIPTNWNQLTDGQLLKIAKLFFSKQPTILFDYKLFKIMTNYKWYKIKLFRKIVILFKNVPIESLKETFHFVYKKQDLTRFIKVVKIRSKWYKKPLKYYAPANRLTNLSIGEFAITEDLYLGYLRNCKSSKTNYGYSYLIYLFAVLYITNSNPKRPKFSKDQLELMVNEVSKVPKKNVLACLLSYKGCRDAIATNKKYKHIFPTKKTNPKAKLKIPASSGFSDVILSFSNKLFGNYHETYETNLLTFLDGYEIELKKIPKDGTTNL